MHTNEPALQCTNICYDNELLVGMPKVLDVYICNSNKREHMALFVLSFIVIVYFQSFDFTGKLTVQALSYGYTHVILIFSYP